MRDPEMCFELGFSDGPHLKLIRWRGRVGAARPPARLIPVTGLQWNWREFPTCWGPTPA
jgi:hypothetical protein